MLVFPGRRLQPEKPVFHSDATRRVGAGCEFHVNDDAASAWIKVAPDDRPYPRRLRQVVLVANNASESDQAYPLLGSCAAAASQQLGLPLAPSDRNLPTKETSLGRDSGLDH